MSTAEAALKTSYDQVLELLGGDEVVKRPVNNALDAHDVLEAGLPARVITLLTRHLVYLHHDADVARALGMSLRTVQRKSDAPMKKLNSEQSSRAWKFAEVLARAIAVFGGQQQAEQWLSQPAIGLGRRRPIELLATQAGLGMVEDHLTQLEYGVYT